MRFSSLFLVPALLLAGSFFACGGRVDAGDGQPEPQPTGSPTGSPTGTPTSTPTASPTGTGTTEPVPPSPTCSHTGDRLDITVGGAITASCYGRPEEPSAPTAKVFTGEIIKTGPGFLEIDTCPPTADCAASLVTLSVKGEGLDLSSIPRGSLVTVTTDFRWSWGCTATVLVQSIAEWGGMKNPVDGGGRTYLVGGEGVTAVAGAPFSVDRRATGCMKPPPYPSCGPAEVDDFELTFLGAGSPTVYVPMGGYGKFVADGQVFVARNLRSYYDGACDAYWNYAFWAKSDGK